MSTGAALGIAIVILAVLAVLVLVVTSRRSDARQTVGALSRETVKRDRGTVTPSTSSPATTGREVERAAVAERAGTSLVAASDTELAPWVPPDPEQLGVTRRQFFNRSAVTLMSVGLGGFGASVVGFLWPKLSGGFGSKINIGKVDDVLTSIKNSKGFFYVPEGRAWVTAYPKEALAKAQGVYAGPVLSGMEAGVVALYQKCPHLGCRVPQCETSQWFECPCHGSQYNRVGEKKGGPAPRGMDLFAVSVSGGTITIDTGQIFQGAPIGTNTTGQEAEGPHCISGGH
ncbi:MAG: ubiquinol-cytochrome c reductase iron-sulfur subunit [Acidimicrobiia bacterium]